MKSLTVTLKRLLLFGLPALAVTLFFIIGFAVLNKKNAELMNDLTRANDDLTRTNFIYRQITGSHQIVVKGIVVETINPIGEIVIRLNNPVLKHQYVCVMPYTPQTQNELNGYVRELETGRSNILVIAGFVLDKPVENRIAIYNCTIIGGAYEAAFNP